MAVDTEPSQANMNAHGHGDRSTRKRKGSKPKSLVGWTFDKALKAAVWYTIITLAFRCPPTQEDLKDDSPRICKPSLQLRDAVTPYTQPHIDHYLAPYVKQAQPYIDQFNAKVYEPGVAAYEKYGAPRVAGAQKFSQQQWQKTIKPQLEVLKKETGKQYETLLGPHVKKAQNLAQPYYNSVRTSANDIWDLELEPVYRRTKPYAEKLYHQGQEFAVKTALPQAQAVGNSVWTVWTRQVWPRLRVLYGENVEPQLLRITERLGRYKDGKKLEADIKSMETSSKLSEASASASSIASSVSSTAKVVTESTASAASAASEAAASKSPEFTPDPKVQFLEDLKSWEHISAKAVEEGSEDLKERIQDIADTQIRSAGSVGGALVTQLDETTESALSSVKARIQQIVRNLPHDSEQSHIEDANEELVTSIRAAGQTIKQRAQAVREWRQSKDAETAELVEKALQSTLETVEHIRDLRLTEIGRKYASSSLPHKEWSKYNDLKKATQTWRKDVKKSAHEHSGVAKAKSASEDIENQAMAIAEDAAKELGRLKEVGKWKIAADEDSDDFSTRHIPPPVRKAKEQVMEKVAEVSEAMSEQLVGSEPPAREKVIESASSSFESVANKLSDKVVGSSTGSVESATSVAAEKASKVASNISEAVIGSSSSAAAESVKSSIEDAASKLSEKVIGSEPPAVESLSKKASKSVSSVASSVSSAVLGESSLSDSLTDITSAASAAILGSEKPVQSVNSKLANILSSQKANVDSASKSASSILEEATGSSPTASKILASISSVASDAASVVSSASSAVSERIPSGDRV